MMDYNNMEKGKVYYMKDNAEAHAYLDKLHRDLAAKYPKCPTGIKLGYTISPLQKLQLQDLAEEEPRVITAKTGTKRYFKDNAEAYEYLDNLHRDLAAKYPRCPTGIKLGYTINPIQKLML